MKAAPRGGGGSSAAVAAIRSGQALPVGGRLARHRLDHAGWLDLEAALRADPLPLLSLWADAEAVHALFLAPEAQPVVASVGVERARYLALSAARPAAALCERIVRDLWGHEAMSARDLRPWLDHGAWGVTAPRAARPGPAAYPPEPVEFAAVPERARRGGMLRVDGPAAAGASPRMLAVSLTRSEVLDVEPRLGCAHRGVDALLTGRPVGAAVRLASRIDGGAAVAHALALARAIEDAAGFDEAQSPELAERRRILLELERLGAHLHGLGVQARLFGASGVATDLAEAVEAVRACCAEGWDHRLLFDTVAPGDAAPVAPGLERLVAGWRRDWAALARRWDAAAAAALPGLAVLPPATALRHGVCGVAGRAAGQGFDARRLGGRQLGAEISAGDALARGRLRWREIGASLELLVPQVRGQSVLPLKPAFGAVGGEGLGVAEGPRGPVWAWVRLEAGMIAAVWFADPSLPVWAALPEVLAGTAADALDLALASLGLGVAGADR